MAAGRGGAKLCGKKSRGLPVLTKTEDLIGTWSEYSQLHRLNCVVLPDELNGQDYWIAGKRHYSLCFLATSRP